MLPIIPESDLDGANIQSKMLNILKHLTKNDTHVELTISEDLEHSFFYYRQEIIKMIQNNQTTLEVNYNHICMIDNELSEVIFFFYYKVVLTSTRNLSLTHLWI